MAALPTTYSGTVRIGVIGGTGLSAIPDFTPVASIPVMTPWGVPSSPIAILEHPSPTTTGQPTPIAFLSRHGLHHEFPPHQVNSRANIAALRSLGVRSIIAFSAVGSLQEDVKPRDFVVPDQIIDRTKGIRPFTFFDDGMVGHIPFADPFDDGLAQVIRSCGGQSLAGEGVTLHERGTVVCMEGPQFSTRAESKLYRTWGGTVINMSALPEAKLAREAEIAYQMICMSTDYDSWHDVNETVHVEMVMAHMKANSLNARRFVGAVLDKLTKAKYGDLVAGRHLAGQSKFCVTTAREGISPQAMERLEWLFPGIFAPA